jgi:hypothetical protein
MSMILNKASMIIDSIFLNVVARGGTVRWNRYITPDLCFATSWLHDLISDMIWIKEVH